MRIDNITKWGILTEEITKQFIFDYFDDSDPEYFWVGSEIGGVLNYGDYWFNFSDILICYKLNIEKEQLFKWYDYKLKWNNINISLARFILSPEEKDVEKKRIKQEFADAGKLAALKKHG